ncbi:uncharacterized protein LOC129243540 [Anastrepha obliqua]|uniref:uncharacterized protein LOC129243540 n=1 Tax=Anastrepha obliqua TaxID=95512 RepID=UPI002409799E|nr:uncharacterized protein LOC129243540 [Anastrepha obliqua]
MRLSLVVAVVVILLVTIASLPAEGKRVTLVPLSASEVYRLLREAGQEDAVPEGRVVTQGIAAVSGFAVGLAKGIGGSLLVDLATNLWSSTSQNPSQEICFNSRSLNEINDVDYGDENANGDTDYAALGRQTVDDDTATTSTGNVPSTTGGSYSDSDNNRASNGDNTATYTSVTTEEGTGGAVNCVVL